VSLQIILKNSSVSGKEPTASQLANGELALNYHADGPFISCKDSAGTVRRIAGVWISTTAPTSPTPGEFWLDINTDPAKLKVYKDGTDNWVETITIVAATTTTAGVVELATDAETQAGSLANRAVTPASLQSKISDSTTTTSSTTIASSTAVKSAKDVADAALPAAGGTISGNLTVSGDLTVNGTTTTIDTETLEVKDKNIEMGVVSTPSDVTADGGGITLKGTTDKTLNWVDSTDSWTSSENVDLATGKTYKIAGTDVLSGTTLGSGITGSSLTSVGTITSGTWNGTQIATAYIADSAITSAKIEDGTIVNNDVNASAAIAGTKIDPDFGAQNLIVDTDVLFVDATDDRVGVGTSSPGQLLHLSSTNPRIQITHETSTTHAYIDAATQGILEFSTDDNNQVASSEIRFKIDGSQKAVIDADGYLGVRVTDPLYPISVDGNIGLVNTGTNAAFLITTKGGQSTYFGVDNSAGDVFGTGTGYSPVIYTGANTPICFATNGTVRTQVKADGTLYSSVSSNDVPAAHFKNGGGSAPATLLVEDSFSSTTHRGLWVGKADFSDSVLVTRKGNVGIGVNDPSQKLHIDAHSTDDGVNYAISSNIQGNATYGTAAGYFINSDTGTGTGFGIYVIGSDYGVFSNGGTNFFQNSVGIGKTSPDSSLHVAASGSVALTLEDTDGSNQIGTIGHNGGDTTFTSRNGTNNGVFTWYGYNGTLYNPHMRLVEDGGLLITGYTNRYVSGSRLEAGGPGGAIVAFGTATGYTEGRLVCMNRGGTSRGCGMYMHTAQSDATSPVEWYAGRPYNSNDRFIIARQIDHSSIGSNTAQLVNELLRIEYNGAFLVPEVYGDTTSSAANVHINSAGQLFRSTSSIRYKKDVETIEDSYADAILNCRPVWYKSTSELDNPDWGYWGFIAEEVAEVDPRLVNWKTEEHTYDEEGEPVSTPCEPIAEGVQYDRFVPHLVNLIKRQNERIEQLEARLAALEA